VNTLALARCAKEGNIKKLKTTVTTVRKRNVAFVFVRPAFGRRREEGLGRILKISLKLMINQSFRKKWLC
jgi:hypothetical protein